MKDYARSFYNSKAWRDTQAAFMVSRYYVCERCSGLARIVHHARHITPENIHDPAITLDWANLEALCIDCHNREHMGKGDVCAPGLTFDVQGNVIYTPLVANENHGPSDRRLSFQNPSKGSA